MPRDHMGKWMAASALVFAVVVQIAVIVWAGGPGYSSAPVTEAMNVPAK